jgi:hypothetical protein
MILPGGITLAGFSHHDVTTLLVVQKIVGRYAREYANDPGFSGLRVALTRQRGEFAITATATVNELAYAATAVNENLFVALGEGLQRLTTLVHQTSACPGCHNAALTDAKLI